MKILNTIKNKLNEIKHPDQLKKGLNIITLGGLEQIGMNFNLFIKKKELIGKNEFECVIMDAGISNLSKEYGVSTIFSDFSFIEKFNTNTKFSIVCTHGHLDHIGAIKYLLKSRRFKNEETIDVYGSNFTLEVIKATLKEEKRVLNKINFLPQPMNEKFTIRSFGIKLINITHSIPESTAIQIFYEDIVILHSGDWKIDPNPGVGLLTDIEELKKTPVDLFLCDSTNSIEIGHSGSEGEVLKAIEKCFQIYKNKLLIFSCFASNIARVEAIRKTAESLGKLVFIRGRSLSKMYEAAQECGLVPKNIVLNGLLKKDMDLTNVVIIATGSQGEEGSALNKLLGGSFDFVTEDFLKDSVVIFSSRVIPGLSNQVIELKQKLIQAGAIVLDRANWEDVHVSGHPSSQEIAFLLETIDIKQVLPIHGTAYHQQGVVRLCNRNNKGPIPFILGFNGCVFVPNIVNKKVVFERFGKISTFINGVDGNQIIQDFKNSPIILNREQIAHNGIIIVSVLNKDFDIKYIGVAADNDLKKVLHTDKNTNEKRSVTEIIESLIKDTIKNTEKSQWKNNIEYILNFNIKRFFDKTPLLVINLI